MHFDEAPLGPRARFRQTVHQIFSNALDVSSFFAIFSCLRPMVYGFLKFLKVAKLLKMHKLIDVSLNFMVFEGPKWPLLGPTFAKRPESDETSRS